MEKRGDMRRPIIALCCGTAAGCAFSYKISAGIYQDTKFWILFLLMLILSGFALKYYGKPSSKAHKLTMLLLVCGIIFGSVTMMSAYKMHSKLYYSVGESLYIEGVVLKTECDENGMTEKIKVRSDDGSLILVSLHGEAETLCDITGENVSFRSMISLPTERRNPGYFDYRLYLKSLGIETVSELNVSQLDRHGISKNPYHRYLRITARFRYAFTEWLSQEIGTEYGGLIAAMMFGSKVLVQDDVYYEFQRNGTAHVLAVSGLHIGAVYAALRFAIGKRRNIVNFAITALCMVIYAALASFAPSVMRAAAMITVHAYGDLKNRRYDMLCTACTCMLITIAANPYIIFNTGFRLSYTAVISICVCGRFLSRFIRGSLLSMLSVQIGMAASTMQAFNYISISSLIANLPIVFLTGLVVPSGIVLMIMFMLRAVPGVEGIMAVTAEIPSFLCDAIIRINSFTYAGGAFTFDVVSPSMFLTVMYLGIVSGISSEQCFIWWKKGHRMKIAAALALLVIFAALADIAYDDGFGDAGLVFVDVGQGDCLHIRTSDGYNYLIDGGGSVSYDVGEKVLKPYLLKNGVRKVDAAFVTHLHEDHYGGIVSLCRAGMIKKLCLYEGNIVNEEKILNETGLEKENIVYLSEGDILRIGCDVTAAVMSPPSMSKAEYEKLAAADDENSNSLILRIDYAEISVLMTGDIDADAEKALAERHKDGVKCTILKAAHHGSKYSSCDEFTEAVNPKLVMFQVGKNNYGHPDKTLIEKLEEKGIMIYRNDTDGAVGIVDMDGSPHIIKMIESE